jgi:peptidyl-prolyl cis-trans isomerase B (cyclophilin B)
MKKFICLAMLLVIMFAIVPAVTAYARQNDIITITLDGRTLTFTDVPPQIVNGRTMVPFRFIGEELGAQVEWKASENTVYAQMGDTVINLLIGDTSPTVNGTVVNIEQPAYIKDGRTLVPLRFISEAFGAKVDWDDVTQTVSITSQHPDSSYTETIQATIKMEDGGVIVLALYPDLAPQTVRNFVYLARKGFYDGLKFHRIISGFMIQGGSPDGSGSGGPGYRIKGEFTENGVVNGLTHTRGVISMARTPEPNSAGSQFFIMHGNAPNLDGLYAAFGRVISGMDVVDKIAGTPNDGENGSVADSDKPVIKSITIDDDIELPEPEKL